MSGDKQRVAILGGGVGSVVAAHQLTSTPELRARYDVTLYQLGWRLGGKGASGRNAGRGQRIEEHGLHLWLGFYDNAFQVMRDCYEELARPPGTPLATWAEAFTPCDDIALYADFGDGWRGWNFTLPRNPQIPGDPTTLPGFWAIARAALGWLHAAWESLRSEQADLTGSVPPEHLPHFVEHAMHGVTTHLRDLGHSHPDHLLEAALRLAERRAGLAVERELEGHHRSLVAELLQGFTHWLWDHVVAKRQDDADLCLFFTMVDTAGAAVAGIVADELIEKGFDAANDKDLREWLGHHGAHPLTLEHGPLLRGLYDMAFAYVDGDVAQPNAAAGTALHDLIRLLFAYRGAFYWRMNAGMGDTVFVPFYEVLRRRGVHFRFFHWVTRLGLSTDRRFVEEIAVVPQVDLAVADYDPLVDVKDLPCWPTEPCWQQIVDGDRLKATGVNLEHDPNPLGREPVVLRREADFDLVVLGIPVGALEPLCAELTADAGNPRFRAMLEHSATNMTQGFQVWLNRPAEALGWRYGERSGATAYLEPISSYAPMTHLLPREDWSEADGVAHLGYFCGVLADQPGDTQEGAMKRAKAQATAFLESQVGGLWPQTTGSGGEGFDWDLLFDPAGGEGAERFDAQYWVANFPATERYVLTLAGSVEHRLRADESGYENLYLAGDWVRTGLDGGCVEAAAMAGMQASRAICGVPRIVVGEDHGWLANQVLVPAVTPARDYVEYGGLATCPPPVECSDATLFGFLLEADHERLAALCQRVFAEPTGGEFDYRPIGRRVLLTFGHIARLAAQQPPFSQMGYAIEKQASLWVPVARVRQEGPDLVAESLCWFVPYMWVDNPMSLACGREVFGYPKNWGWFELELPPPQAPERLAVDAYGGNFGTGGGAGRHPLIEVTRVAGSVPDDPRAEPRWPSLEAAVRHLQAVLLAPDQGIVVPGLHLFEGLFHDLLRRQGPPQVFLKQFRSITGRPGPAVQQVVEAPVRITRLAARPVLAEHEVIVHPLDSHPLATDLGLASRQTTRLGVRVELDFVLEDGEVLWKTAEH